MTEREKVLEILDRVGFSPRNNYSLSEDKKYILFNYSEYNIKISFDESGNITDIE